jgi:hypothetical protein
VKPSPATAADHPDPAPILTDVSAPAAGEDIAPELPALGGDSPPLLAFSSHARGPAVRTQALLSISLLVLLAVALAVNLADVSRTPRLAITAAAMFLIPGSAVAKRMRLPDLVSWLSIAFIIGMAIDAAISVVLVFAGWWHPKPVALAVAAVAAAVLARDLSREIRWAHAAGRRVMPESAPTGTPDGRLGKLGKLALAFGAPLAAIGLWIGSLSSIHVAQMTTYGLPSVLPASWYVALAILIVGLASTICTARPHGLALTLYVVGIALVLFGTVPAAAGEPQYSWVYKHFGVVRYIELHGSVNWAVDIYNRWPGFFSVSAVLSALTGVRDPVHYGAWAEPLFMILDAGLVSFAMRALTPDRRISAAAAALFVVTNWVGQTYFSPQAFAFALALGFTGLLLHQPRASIRGRVERVVARLERFAVEKDLNIPSGSVRMRRLPAVLIGIDLVIAVSHQLTPFMMLIQVTLLTLVGVVRRWWLLAVMAAITFGYLIPHFGFINSNFRLFTSLDPFNNARHAPTYGSAGVPGKQLSAHAGQLLAIGLWVGAAFATARLVRVGLLRRVLPLIVLAAAPFSVIFAANYGGEATLRVILFTAPWCSGLIALAIGSVHKPRTRLLTSVTVMGILAAICVPACLGEAEVNVIPRGEVVASDYFYRHASPGSLLMLAAPDFPVRLAGTYNRFAGPQGDNEPNLFINGQLRGQLLGSFDIPEVVRRMQDYSQNGFLVFSRTEYRFASVYRLTPRGQLQALEDAVAHSNLFQLWYSNRDARIYRLVGGSGQSSP